MRDAIVGHALKSIPAVMQALEWTTPDGCSACRPALNDYLLCAWPGEYVGDGRARFVNERVHADIQKDGAYSVVPRMRGGPTTAAELRAIADVVDKFDIPTVKCTGGQRIDLLGVKKEDLPAVWADLNSAGMVSGHAYGRAAGRSRQLVGVSGRTPGWARRFASSRRETAETRRLIRLGHFAQSRLPGVPEGVRTIARGSVAAERVRP